MENEKDSKSPLQRGVVWLRRKIKKHFDLYDIRDLAIGGHCGCCGEWVPDEIIDKDWRVSLCKKCKDT
jgi:hypothetical protein